MYTATPAAEASKTARDRGTVPSMSRRGAGNKDRPLPAVWRGVLATGDQPVGGTAARPPPPGRGGGAKKKPPPPRGGGGGGGEGGVVFGAPPPGLFSLSPP